MASNPPSDEQEPRWQQPNFESSQSDREYFTPSPPEAVMPWSGSPSIPPAGTFETVIGTLASLFWPIAIAFFIFTRVSFWPALIGTIVVGTVLSAVKNNLKQQRQARAGHIPPAAGPHQR